MSDFRTGLAQATTWSEVLAYAQRSFVSGGPPIFETLFTLALEGKEDRASYNAAALLVFMDPDCPLHCQTVVSRIHDSQWVANRREVPFYLVTHFGKQQLLEVSRQFMADFSHDQRQDSRVTALRYWITGSAESLCAPFHDWIRPK